jgi:hypothetical protein
VIKGNGEGVRSMPENTNQLLFENLRTIGAGLATNGNFDPAALAAFAQPERFPAISGPFFRIFLRLPNAHSYFDQMLKDNGVFERRFARPFIE